MWKKLVIILLAAVLSMQCFYAVPNDRRAYAAEKTEEQISEIEEEEKELSEETVLPSEDLPTVTETEAANVEETQMPAPDPEENGLPEEEGADLESAEGKGLLKGVMPRQAGAGVTEETEPPVTESETAETETEEETEKPVPKSERVIADGYYYILCSKAMDFGLDVEAARTESGVNVQIYKHNGTRAQIFQVIYDEENSLYSILNEKSGLALTQEAGSENVRQETVVSGQKSQQWVIQKNKDGSFSFINADSGMLLQAENKAASKVNVSVAEKPAQDRCSFTFDNILAITSASISLQDKNYCAKSLTPDPSVMLCGKILQKGKDYQLSYKNNVNPGTASVTLTGIGSYKWSVTKNFRILVPRTLPNGIYYILNASSPGFALDITAASTAAKANVQLYRHNHTPAQMFLVEWQGNGEYKITNIKSKMALDVTGGSVNDRANIQQYPSNNTGAQRWYIFANEDGSWSIANKKSLKLVDVNAARFANKTNIQQYHSNGTKAQKFMFQYVPESDLNRNKTLLLETPKVSAQKYMPGVRVSWKAVRGAQKYRVYRRTGSGSWKGLADITGTSYFDLNVSAGTTYYYTIRCISTDGKQHMSGFQSPGAAAATPKEIPKTGNELRKMVVENANSYDGIKGQSLRHRHIIDVFNELKPDGYPMYYHSPWCAAFVSAVTMEVTGNECANRYFPLSYNCETIIRRAMKMGTWVEKDSYVPKPGDWIIYDWEDNGKGEDIRGYDHVGMVVSVSGSVFTVIEGNYSNSCTHRKVTVNQRYIRGFVSPDYDAVLNMQ